MENSFDKTAITTIDLLEARLRRIEYVVYGQERATIDPEDEIESAATRLENLERALHGLTVKSRVIRDLLQLHSQHPTIFHPSITPSEPHTQLTPSSQQSIILSSASTYNFTSSSLTSVMDVPTPLAESSLQLISLQPRLAKVKLLQDSQEKEIARLREETVRVLQRWYKVDVVGVGEFWADVERKLEDVERVVRRVEGKRREGEGD